MQKPRKARALPTIPPYLATLRAVRLSAQDWRRLVVFLVRRLYRSEPERALQFAWDVRAFDRYRRAQRELPKDDPRHVSPRMLLTWLKRDAPLAKTPTADEQLWWRWFEWATLLERTPRKAWPTLCKHFNDNKDVKSALETCLQNESASKKAVASVARELTAKQQETENATAEALRIRFARAGLPTNAPLFNRR